MRRVAIARRGAAQARRTAVLAAFIGLGTFLLIFSVGSLRRAGFASSSPDPRAPPGPGAPPLASGTAASAAALASLRGVLHPERDPNSNDPQLVDEPPEWDEFVHAGAAYLIRVLHEDGRFSYNLRESGTFNPRAYNVLRHAGATYALASYQLWAREFAPRHDTSAALDATRRAAGYLRQSFVSEVGSELPGALAVWDEPSLIGGNALSRRCAKLGGAGLTLVALSTLEKISPGETPLEDLAKIADFIAFMQKEDGGFVSKYCSWTGFDESFTSLYYPGEAALGLVLLYEVHPDPRFLRIALDALLYLANLRETAAKVEPDHWAMLATERLLKHADAAKIDAEIRRRLTVHAERVVRALSSGMLTMERRKASMPPDGRTTPLATRIEGIIAVVGFDTERTMPELRRFVKLAARFLTRSQILVPGDPRHGGLPKSVLPGKGNGEVRIDYVQHAICGIMRSLEAGLAPDEPVLDVNPSAQPPGPGM